VKYLIDGYNLLFSFLDTSKELKNKRDELIHSLQKSFSHLQLSGMLIFDGAHRREEESGRIYVKNLEIIYTPKGQNADSYILEKIECATNPKEITVVTNDTGLSRQARSLRAHVQNNQSFLKKIQQAFLSTSNDKMTQENPKNKERLLKIFENRS
jgi:predicted RNA-binding protein with PIN domain